MDTHINIDMSMSPVSNIPRSPSTDNAINNDVRIEDTVNEEAKIEKEKDDAVVRGVDVPEYEDYRMLADYVDSDNVDVYTVAAIMVKDYSHSNGWIFQMSRAFFCFISQSLIPIFIIYDSFLTMKNDENTVFCSDTGTWTDKAVSCIMSIFLVYFYLQKWSPFVNGFCMGVIINEDGRPEPKIKGMATLLYFRSLHHYISESVFTMGVVAKMLSHCLNTLACIIVIYQTTGTTNIAVNSCALYFLNDIANIFVDDLLKDECKFYLAHRHQNLMTNNFDHTVTYKRKIDQVIGILGLIFVTIVFPILGFGILLATIGSIIYMPICHP